MIPKDKLLIITDECYDDYHILGLFKAKQDINIGELFSDFHEKAPTSTVSWKINPVHKTEDWWKYLLEKDLLEKIDYSELHLGGYIDYVDKDGPRVF